MGPTVAIWALDGRGGRRPSHRRSKHRPASLADKRPRCARFDFELHNQRRLVEHHGTTPRQTLGLFRNTVTSTTAASGHTAAWLGEVIVHAQDVRRPLGLSRTPAIQAVAEVARSYAGRDFTVDSHSAVAGLRLQATDGPFATDTGAPVTGTTLALTMAMAGRQICCDELAGPGVPTLRARLAAARA